MALVPCWLNVVRLLLLRVGQTGRRPRLISIVGAPCPQPTGGSVLLRGIYLSLTPTCAAIISGDQISEPVGIGVVIEGRVVGQVVRSGH